MLFNGRGASVTLSSLILCSPFSNRCSTTYGILHIVLIDVQIFVHQKVSNDSLFQISSSLHENFFSGCSIGKLLWLSPFCSSVRHTQTDAVSLLTSSSLLFKETQVLLATYFVSGNSIIVCPKILSFQDKNLQFDWLVILVALPAMFERVDCISVKATTSCKSVSAQPKGHTTKQSAKQTFASLEKQPAHGFNGIHVTFLQATLVCCFLGR